MLTRRNCAAGFTLVEILLYLGIVVAVLTAASVFLSISLESRLKNRAIAEVEEQGYLVMSKITQALRNAAQINSPAPGGSSDLLSFNVDDAAKNPSVFQKSGQTIVFKEGASAPTHLLSENITVTDLSFRNLSRPNTKGIVRASFTLEYAINLPGGTRGYAKTFFSSAALR